ncbi:MAG TPA: winged helix-turn-helix domain-containing protein [Luteimonas sp.]|nr:winged helix-turn-helix domain-containing protein [Luteimonas sp.]HRP71875.1 winged helix-turn-helix domain-containing protein [Luteimonas sp.]
MSTSQPRNQAYRWRFGSIEFDEARFELRISGLPVDIEHKPLQVLALLLHHAGEVVTREELFDTVWAGRITVDHVLATAVGKLRKALDAGGQSRIATVPRIGYRFDGQVERVAVGQQLASELELAAGQPVPGRPHFLLERPLGQTHGSEVWLARQPRSRESRVFKFSLDSEHLSAIKREATLMRLLRDTLGEREDFVRVIDWNFESPPFFLECEYGGLSLPEWAAEDDRLAAMERPARIAFFVEIADAVAAAHGVGVLHKDLKPANILVAQRGDGWHPRLTDFGSSRLLQPERLEELGITRLGMTVDDAAASSSGTPLYLAPELIGGQPPTVRSDVYALGVILYQWLVGDLRRPMAPGWEREIDDPLLREDIALATDSDPARRIADAAELAARLRSLPQRRAERARREADEAAAAAMRQTLERTRARRPWIVATIAVLGIGLVASSLLWYHSERQRDAAAMQAARAEAVTRFLADDLLGAVAPGPSGFERDPRMHEVLERASSQIGSRFADDPATRGGVHSVLGQAWQALGERDRGVHHMREAARLYAQAFGDADELSLKTHYMLVRSLAYANSAEQFMEARKLLDDTDAAADAFLRGSNEVALEAAYARGVFHFQQLQIEPALEAFRHADGLQRAVAPDAASTAATIRENIADSTIRQGRPEEGIVLLRAMLADPLLDAGRIGENRIAGHQIMLARALRNLGRYDEAMPMAQAATATSERTLGEDHYSTLIQMSTVASIHDAAGDCALALPLARTVRERMAARYGEHLQATLVETGNLGFKERDCGDREAGLGYIRQAERGLREHYGEDNVAAYSFRYSLVKMLADDSRFAEALDMLDGLDIAALTAGNSRPGWEHRLKALRGRILVRSGDIDNGRRLLADAVPALVALGNEDADEIAGLQALLSGEVPGSAD